LSLLARSDVLGTIVTSALQRQCAGLSPLAHRLLLQRHRTGLHRLPVSFSIGSYH